MSARKNFTSRKNTGFGERSSQGGTRFYSKGGRVNIRRRGLPLFDRVSWYHTLLSMPRWKFWMSLLLTYASVNFLFALIYFAIGVNHLIGIHHDGGKWGEYLDAFFFSGGVPTGAVLDLARTPGLTMRVVPLDDVLRTMQARWPEPKGLKALSSRAISRCSFRPPNGPSCACPS